MNSRKKSICVFCGARDGLRSEFATAANEIGAQIALRGFQLVFGGGKVGLMGQVAKGAMENNGKVIGVIPEGLFALEVGYSGITELKVVKSMHERKALMESLSDAFVALPGGFGTQDELNEIITWKQLGIHQKPIIIFNQDGFYDSYLKFLSQAVDAGFISEHHFQDLKIAKSKEDVFSLLSALFQSGRK